MNKKPELAILWDMQCRLIIMILADVKKLGAISSDTWDFGERIKILKAQWELPG